MASLLHSKEYQFSLNDGTPNNGGLVYFYLTTTLTPKDTYTSEALSVANSNPVVLNTNGRAPNEIWISGRYRRIVKTSAGVTIADDDVLEDSVSASTSQQQAQGWGGNNSGTANELVFTYSPAITSYVNGTPLRGRITANATSGVTVNAGGGVKNLVDGDGVQVSYLHGPAIIEYAYDSTSDVMRLLSVNAVLQQGLHTIPVLASSMFSRTTNGPSVGLTELATNKVMLASKDFDQTTSEGAQFSVPMPKSWNEGTVTAQFGWTAASGAGTVTWTIAGSAFSDDDALDAAFGTAQSVTDTLITANDMHITSVTSAITIGGTPTTSDYVIFQVTRDIADTLNADAKLLWCKVFITYDAGNDA